MKTLNNAIGIKLLSIIFIIMLLQSCSKDPNDGCPDPFTTYYNNIDTINVPYKKNKLFVYKDQNGNLTTTKIITDTIYYNCILEQTTNPNCGTQNTSCYLNKQYLYDTLISLRINNEYNKYFIFFNNSSFQFDGSSLVNPNITFYPYYKSLFIDKLYYDVRLIINSNNDSLFINNNDGILKVTNLNNSYILQ